MNPLSNSGESPTPKSVDPSRALATGMGDAQVAEHSDEGVFEIKFLVDAEMAERILAWSRSHFTPDPHGDPALGGAYHVQTLYLETPDFAIYDRRGVVGQRKMRLRRYGTSAQVFLEQKCKQSRRVRKRRTLVPESDVAALAALGSQPNGFWFHDALLADDYRPLCQITYSRRALLAELPEGLTRLTIDSRLCGTGCRDWSVPRQLFDDVPLLEGQCVVELKFPREIPVLFRQFLDTVQLQPTAFSKYRRCVDLCDLRPRDEVAGQRADVTAVPPTATLASPIGDERDSERHESKPDQGKSAC